MCVMVWVLGRWYGGVGMGVVVWALWCGWWYGCGMGVVGVVVWGWSYGDGAIVGAMGVVVWGGGVGVGWC